MAKAKSKKLTRDDILNIKDIVTEEVYVKPWKGSVFVKTLTGAERDEFERDIVDIKGTGRKTKAEMKGNIRARLVAKSVVDPDTLETIFSPGDVDLLGRKSSAAIDTIFETAQRLSKISDDDVEELAENFSTEGSDTSTSSLPES